MVDKVITNDNSTYWNKFYKNNKIFSASTFCTEVSEKYQKDMIIVDIGCGSGRDSFHFASEGFDVFGIDGSHEAISANNKRANEVKLSGEVVFSRVNLSDQEALQGLFTGVINKAEDSKRKVVLYLRFLLHAIDNKTEQVLLDTIAMYFPVGTSFVAEFRSAEDAEKSKVYNDHYRRFVETDKLLVELIKRNFSIKEFYKGTGLSIYKDEDPFLARVIAEKI